MYVPFNKGQYLIASKTNSYWFHLRVLSEVATFLLIFIHWKPDLYSNDTNLEDQFLLGAKGKCGCCTLSPFIDTVQIQKHWVIGTDKHYSGTVGTSLNGQADDEHLCEHLQSLQI